MKKIEAVIIMKKLGLSILLATICISRSWAGDEPPTVESNKNLIDLVQSHADYVWTLVAAALVFFMQAGFAMVETGFTRAKNAVNIMMKNLMDFSMGSLAFWAIGFGIMFKLIDKTVGLRVSPEEEMEGLDFAEHGGNAYPDFEVSSSSYGGVGSSMGPSSPSATGDAVGQFKPVQQT
jgi:hypothetical protein